MSEPSEEDDLDALEERMRRKLGALQTPLGPKFTDKEAAMARRLLGRDNAESLQRRVRDGERFRPKPVNIYYEYYWTAGTAYTMGGWHMKRVENGRPSDHHFQGDVEKEINRLRAAGFSVKEFRVDGAPPLPTKTAGQRKSFAERYGSFKTGGGR